MIALCKSSPAGMLSALLYGLFSICPLNAAGIGTISENQRRSFELTLIASRAVSECASQELPEAVNSARTDGIQLLQFWVDKAEITVDAAAELIADEINQPVFMLEDKLEKPVKLDKTGCEKAALVRAKMANQIPTSNNHSVIKALITLPFAKAAYHSCVDHGINFYDDKVTGADYIAKAVQGACSDEQQTLAELALNAGEKQGRPINQEMRQKLLENAAETGWESILPRVLELRSQSGH